MDQVEEKYSICHGCLSKDRSRAPLGDYYPTYLLLLGHRDIQAKGLSSDLLLCWECIARLKSIRTFQNRIKDAQNTLEQFVYLLNEFPSTLSSLKIEITDHYDHSTQNDVGNLIIYNKEIKSENLVEVETLPVSYDCQDICHDIESLDYDNQIFDNQTIDNDNQIVNDHNNFDNDLTSNIIENSQQNKVNLNKEHQQPNKLIKKKEKDTPRKKRNQVSFRKYEKYAKVDKLLNIEGEDLRKWYNKVNLSEKEMEDLLDKDRTSKATWKFPKKCENCDLVYRRSIDLKRHIAFHHLKTRGTHRCAHCRVKSTSLADLKMHWVAAHTCVYACVACGATCRDTCGIARHVEREHASVYTCIECGVARSTLQSFSDHYKECHENVTCDYCGRSFHKKTTLIKHIKYKHTTPICDVCNRTFQNHKALTKHRYIVHAITVRGPQPRDLAYCVECDKQFPTIYKYRYHLSQSPRHQSKNKFMKACPECGKVFSRAAIMNHHYKLVHLKDTRYKCDICNKCFPMNSRLKQHQRVVHQKIGLPKNKICDICGKGFTTNRILTEHRRTHTGERPYKCGYCECAFAQKGAMLVHQRTQHKTLHNTEQTCR